MSMLANSRHAGLVCIGKLETTLNLATNAIVATTSVGPVRADLVASLYYSF